MPVYHSNMLEAHADWRPRAAPEELVARLEQELALNHLAARLLVTRGVTTPERAEGFLTKRLQDLHKPELLQGMEAAANRFAAAINNRERILVHGDFDVDGSTAATLLKQFCQACGHDALAWIPHRVTDGYGLTEASVEAVREHQAQLMVTVDCGITDGGLAKRIEQELNCAVIVTDHHLPGDQLPECTAVVNPNQPGCTYPDKGLAGVGVAWKLCWATAKVLCGSDRISDRLRDFMLDALALVALGTVADCAPLDQENRILVHHGLRKLLESSNPGLRALLSQARIDSTISADDIGWRIGPLLNASGRLASATRNIDLLTATSADEADGILAEIVRDNDERRRLTQILTDDLLTEVQGNQRYLQRSSLVFSGDSWHPGIIGIVASRLVEEFGKPSCVIAVEDGIGRGSLRTIPGVHLANAIEACSDLLIKGGGHAAAAGLTISAENIPAFSEAFEHHITTTNRGSLDRPAIEHDGVVSIRELDSDFYAILETLGPFGAANPEPVFHLPGVSFVTRPEVFGRGGDHLRGAVTDPGGGMKQIFCWRSRDRIEALQRPGSRFEILVKPEINHWRGEAQQRLVLIDGRSA